MDDCSKVIRRLIVCFDGTWNTPDSGKNPTNVVKMVRAIRNKDDGISQVTFYDEGVGTGDALDRIAGGASGKGLNKNMIEGYRFLANNYLDRDEIYIFGFSRGAYTARSLVGFIHLAGMISPQDLGGKLEQAIEVYRGAWPPEEKQRRVDDIGLTRSQGIPIECIGVWDTVGALGIPGDLGRRLLGKKFYFQDVQLNDKVKVALHAIAIDEKRSAFAPTLWVRPQDKAPAEGQTVEQVWFPGVHSNVGGSYRDAGLSDTAMDWMVKRVTKLTGLKFDPAYLADHVKPNAFGKAVESRTALYVDSKAYPYERLINQTIPQDGGFGGWFRKTFRALDRRNIPPKGLQTINEMLHISALERCTRPVVSDCPEAQTCDPCDYRPPNLVAVISQARQTRPVPVVGWDGEIMPAGSFDWPQV